jgi:hypothetical protein
MRLSMARLPLLIKVRHPTVAFDAYEAATRPNMAANQRLVKQGSTTVAPGSALEVRNSMIRLAPLLSRVGVLGSRRGAYEALVLPDFDRAR